MVDEANVDGPIPTTAPVQSTHAIGDETTCEPLPGTETLPADGTDADAGESTLMQSPKRKRGRPPKSKAGVNSATSKSGKPSQPEVEPPSTNASISLHPPIPNCGAPAEPESGEPPHKRKRGRPSKSLRTGMPANATYPPQRKSGRPPKPKSELKGAVIMLTTKSKRSEATPETDDQAAPPIRKRGRPPKPKVELASTSTAVAKPKRGRPPSNKPKRGRPPKVKAELPSSPAKPKRGRPPTKKGDSSGAPPPKRGRPPKLKQPDTTSASQLTPLLSPQGKVTGAVTSDKPKRGRPLKAERKPGRPPLAKPQPGRPPTPKPKPGRPPVAKLKRGRPPKPRPSGILHAPGAAAHGNADDEELEHIDVVGTDSTGGSFFSQVTAAAMGTGLDAAAPAGGASTDGHGGADGVPPSEGAAPAAAVAFKPKRGRPPKPKGDTPDAVKRTRGRPPKAKADLPSDLPTQTTTNDMAADVGTSLIANGAAVSAEAKETAPLGQDEEFVVAD
mmetsp:Transcript_38894/g.81635  ORF Transcript_38894/g.81635 Transcript_38894/m.81635 type:complete len:502 (-) Transcript_38894:716-2221(-)